MAQLNRKGGTNMSNPQEKKTTVGELSQACANLEESEVKKMRPIVEKALAKQVELLSERAEKSDSLKDLIEITMALVEIRKCLYP